MLIASGMLFERMGTMVNVFRLGALPIEHRGVLSLVAASISKELPIWSADLHPHNDRLSTCIYYLIQLVSYNTIHKHRVHYDLWIDVCRLWLRGRYCWQITNTERREDCSFWQVRWSRFLAHLLLTNVPKVQYLLQVREGIFQAALAV